MGTIDYTGQVIDGKYRIIRVLGQGGMGAVYLGQHNIIGKKVAVKFLHADLAGNADVVKRFYREAQAAVAIAHKNIIDVMDVGVSNENEPYLVMEYLEGESLSSMLSRKGPITLAAACGIMEPALLALAAAHEKGIIHRDLKPENIFLMHVANEAPTIKLIDFGISKFTGQKGQSQLTQTGTMLGTPAYMSPEQIRGDKTLDHRSDIYAMGVILYEMLTGELPFEGEHYNQLLISVLTESPHPPKEIYGDFPEEAEELLMKLLSKDPAGRPQSSEEFLGEIKQLAGFEERQAHLTQCISGIKQKSFAGGDLGSEIGSLKDSKLASDVLSEMAGQPTPGQWTETMTSPRRWVGIVGGAVVVLLIAVIVLLLLPKDEEKQPTPVVPLAAPSPQPQASEPPADEAEKTKSVEIEVTGAPNDATIFYDKVQLPQNPFKVAPSKNMTQLKVVAAGYEDFVTWIVPEQSQKVPVKLKPAKIEEQAKAATSKRSSSKRSSSRRSKKETTKEKSAVPAPKPKAKASDKARKKLQQGGRDIKFTEDFD